MKTLVRPLHDRMIAGVLSGIAQYVQMDAAVVRLIFIALLLLTGVMPFALLYVLAVFVIPNEGMQS